MDDPNDFEEQLCNAMGVEDQAIKTAVTNHLVNLFNLKFDYLISEQVKVAVFVGKQVVISYLVAQTAAGIRYLFF
jgi:hypothetical protein